MTFLSLLTYNKFASLLFIIYYALFIIIISNTLDIVNGFNVWHDDEETGYSKPSNKYVKIAVEDSLTLNCAASIYKYSDNIQWFMKNNIIESDSNHVIQKSHTPYSNRLALIIKNVKDNDSGIFSCRVSELGKGNRNFITGNVSVYVSAPEPPHVKTKIMNDTEYTMMVPKKLILDCLVDGGIPHPTVTWYKDNIDLSSNFNDKKISFRNKGQILEFEYTEEADEGQYVCVAKNRVGEYKKSLQLVFSSKFFRFYKIYCIPITLLVLPLKEVSILFVSRL